MPLPPPDPRHGAHHRNIDMKTFSRDDGGFDVEGHLVDTKPFPFERMAAMEIGVSRDATYDALINLEEAGLIRVSRHRGRSPVVTSSTSQPNTKH